MSERDKIELCVVPRWAQLKTQLVNLEIAAFIQEATRDEESILLDVRTALEFKTGSLPGAINLNYLSLTLADELESLDPAKNYYIFCRTGRRSLRVCMLLKNIGITVYNLDKGIRDNSIKGII